MSTSKFAEIHNLVAFLDKPKESEGFEKIIDFLNAISIRYALTMNPTIYTSCIMQFWATAKHTNTPNHLQQDPKKKQSKRNSRKDNGPPRAFTNEATNEEHCVSTLPMNHFQSGEILVRLKEILEFNDLQASVADSNMLKLSYFTTVEKITTARRVSTVRRIKDGW
ncbi:hypothetical protein Tco_0298736 [Tanacetum coccineum]